MGGFTALIVPDLKVSNPDDTAPAGLNDLSLIRKLPGVVSAKRYHLSKTQRIKGPWPVFFTLVKLDGEAGVKAFTQARKDNPNATEGSKVGIFQSLRPRKGEPEGVKVPYMMIAMTTPKPGREDEYNDWYWDRHLPDGMKLPGVISGERFHIQRDVSDEGFVEDYMALYDINTTDIANHIAVTNRISRTPEMPVSDALRSGFGWYVVPSEE